MSARSIPASSARASSSSSPTATAPALQGIMSTVPAQTSPAASSRSISSAESKTAGPVTPPTSSPSPRTAFASAPRGPSSMGSATTSRAASLLRRPPTGPSSASSVTPQRCFSGSPSTALPAPASPTISWPEASVPRFAGTVSSINSARRPATTATPSTATVAHPAARSKSTTPVTLAADGWPQSAYIRALPSRSRSTTSRATRKRTRASSSSN
jgi:hypothetical protein